MKKNIHIGLDAGSVSIKLVLLDEQGSVISNIYRRHKGQPLATAIELLQTEAEAAGQNQLISVTGSAGRLIANILGIEPVNEVVAHAAAMASLYPEVKTVIELGGEDSKLIMLDSSANTVKDFSMNSVCAAGTGSFLDQQAERLRLTIEEFSSLSTKSKNPSRIAGRCSVFAKSDMIHLQQIATPVEDIVAGLCFAVARNFKGSIIRGREILRPVAFVGGVAANKGMSKAFREVLGIEDLLIPKEHAITGAIGAVLKDRQTGSHYIFGQGALQKLRDFSYDSLKPDKGHKPLIAPEDDFPARHIINKEFTNKKTSPSPLSSPRLGRVAEETSRGEDGLNTPPPPVTGYLGIDIGSISTNLAVLDSESRLLAKRYLMTAGRPIEAVMQGLEEIGGELGDSVEILGVGTTGSGRYMIADFVGADIVKNEITAQATAAAFIDKDVDTIFEIGGQDSKYISLRDGVIVDFEMNKACAAGTGSFLEEQAEKMGIQVKEEFQGAALKAETPCRLGERCTVFMENSLTASLQRGAEKKDLLAGLSYSIVQNYINRVVCSRPIGNKIFFQGGVAFNKSVVAAFEKYLGKQIIVPPHHDVTGAIGMALIAKEHIEKQGPGNNLTPGTKFKGFGLAGRKYAVSSFECRACPNVCEINRVKIENEEGFLFYGGRCEKYDVRKQKPENSGEDLFGFRQEKLWEHIRRQGTRPEGQAQARAVIGIPYIFYFHDHLPFWSVLLQRLGFAVEVSPPTDRKIIDFGLENVLAETCFPVKAANGHIRYLVEKGVDAILLPSFVDLNPAGDLHGKGLACPYTQTVPYTAGITFRGTKLLRPVVSLKFGDASLKKELLRVFSEFGIKPADIRQALKPAWEAQKAFTAAMQQKGQEVLSSLKDLSIVIAGRAYNAFDSGMNLDLPKKLALLGVTSIPMDMLPLGSLDIRKKWPDMYWRAGQRIISAGAIIRDNPLLYPIYIGNFSCGPDSFILKFFEQEMQGKPYLHLEIDAHSADAGAVTRCEAFLDSVTKQLSAKSHGLSADAKKGRRGEIHSAVTGLGNNGSSRTRKRIVYVPRMSDHAFAVAAAFKCCGVEAEVLPEPTKESVDTGRKYVSGKECYPCAVTTGDMVTKIMGPDFDPDTSAFFMPSGSGPCRFGQYNIFHRMVVSDLGLKNTPILSPSQNQDLYRHLGMVGKEFPARCWEGIIAIELLLKCLRETRPYEKDKGSSDLLYKKHLATISGVLQKQGKGLEAALLSVRKEFEAVPKDKGRKPLIGIVGEIFVRSNNFSNEDLARSIEALGGEAYCAPVEEWFYYINHIGIRNERTEGRWGSMAGLKLRRYFQKKTEHRLSKHFRGYLRTLQEPDTSRLLELAAPYLHDSFEGEAVLSIGKSLDLISRGASGLVNAMPFGCMPGTIVSSLLRGVNMDHGIPCLSIPFDGTESATMKIQLEAFMDQARSFRRPQV